MLHFAHTLHRRFDPPASLAHLFVCDTRVILKHPPHVLQLAPSQPKTLGTPHVLLPPKQLLVGTPHTISAGMTKSREGWYPPHPSAYKRSFDQLQMHVKRVFPPIYSTLGRRLSIFKPFLSMRCEGRLEKCRKWRQVVEFIKIMRRRRRKNGVCLHSSRVATCYPP